MSLIRDLPLLPVWVNPQHLTATALLVLSGHRLRAVGVLDGTALVGVLTREEAAAAGANALVSQAMRPIERTVAANEDVRVVADVFVAENLDFAPVLDGDTFLGVVTATMLLKELGRSYDPLTGLSWSDRLREWGHDQLQAGEELTIVFVDLDQFGQYNKRFGHIVGDKVLQGVAKYLRERIVPETDVLVRYGGDEFAIASVRPREELEEFAEELKAHMDELRIEESPQPVTFSLGIHGGRRRRERENVHPSATLDNLINIASRNCQLAKQARVDDAPADRPPLAAYQLLSVHADPSAERGVTTVILSVGGAVASGADPRGGKPLAESVAVAAAKALERAVAGSSLSISRVEIIGEGDDRLVRVQGQGAVAGVARPVSAERKVGSDEVQATALATIEALLSAQVPPSAS